MAPPERTLAIARMDPTSVVKASLSVASAMRASFASWWRGECLAVDQVGLDVRTDDLVGARHEGLNGVGDVVGLVEHVGRGEVGRTVKLGIHQLVEDEEELEGLDGARVEIVVPVLAVVEMESRKLPELDEPGHDHLDVHVRGMVAEVHE